MRSDDMGKLGSHEKNSIDSRGEGVEVMRPGFGLLGDNT